MIHMTATTAILIAGGFPARPQRTEVRKGNPIPEPATYEVTVAPAPPPGMSQEAREALREKLKAIAQS